jgi:glutamate/tyrosine decarboxylase-like PLP-dependent enzyme
MPENCDPRDVAAKSFFIGPQSENGDWFARLTGRTLARWLEWRRGIFPEDGAAISPSDQANAEFRACQASFEACAADLSRRFEGELPRFSPRYLGHMLSEISLPALLGHWIATLHNPNNISTESAPVGVQIEREAIDELRRMAGFSESAIGHFVSCGSVANFEATLRARDRIAIRLSAEGSLKRGSVFATAHSGWDESPAPCAPLTEIEIAAKIQGLGLPAYAGSIMLVPENKHYSWVKAAHLLGIGVNNIWPIGLDRDGVAKPQELRRLIEKARSLDRPIALIVSVVGTTELGNIDPAHEVQDLLDGYREREGLHFWHHIDGAYGGFLLSLRDASPAVFDERCHQALRAVARANSLTIDPHKLGYAPYACAAFICRDRRDYAARSFDSPYIQYRDRWEPGPFTIEGSRSASGPAATWLTLKAIGSGAEGYGRIVARTVHMREILATELAAIGESVRVLPAHHSNVLCFTVGARGGRLSEANEWVNRFYQHHSSPRSPYIVSKTALRLDVYRNLGERFFAGWAPKVDAKELALIRLTLMNPFLSSKEMRAETLHGFSGCVREWASRKVEGSVA